MLITMAKLHIQLRKMTLFKKDLLYINPVVYKDYLYTYLIGTGIRVKNIHVEFHGIIHMYLGTVKKNIDHDHGPTV